MTLRTIPPNKPRSKNNVNIYYNYNSPVEQSIVENKSCEINTFYTTKDIQEAYKISYQTALKIMKDPRFPSIRIEHRYYVERKKFEEFNEDLIQHKTMKHCLFFIAYTNSTFEQHNCLYAKDFINKHGESTVVGDKISLKKAAKILKIPYRQLRRLILNNKIKAKKESNCWQINVKSLVDYLYNPF